MDGKLTGRLSPTLHLTCKLSVTPRDGPAPMLKTKTVTENGTYRAAAEGADGYSEVTVDIHAGLLKPHAFDLSGGYVMNGAWVVGSDTVCYSDVYWVRAGNAYFISLGSEVGSRFRCMFSFEDTSVAKARVAGKTVTNINTPSAYASVTFSADSDGFLTITKDNAGTANLKTYVFSLADLIAGNE